MHEKNSPLSVEFVATVLENQLGRGHIAETCTRLTKMMRAGGRSTSDAKKIINAALVLAKMRKNPVRLERVTL